MELVTTEAAALKINKVVRFALRKNVDPDEVHIAWAIGETGVVDGECEIVVVQGLERLTRQDRLNHKGLRDGVAGPSAVAAALLCAMHKVIVLDSRLPMKYKKNQSMKPVNEIPEGWRLEVDNQDVLDVLDRDTERSAIVPYGRFLWPALNGRLDLVSLMSRNAAYALRDFASVLAAVMIGAKPNQVSVVNSCFGPLILTRHLVERSMERLSNLKTVSAVITDMARRLAHADLKDVTPLFAKITDPVGKGVRRVFVQTANGEMLAHVVVPDLNGDTVVTIYPLSVADKARVIEFLRVRAPELTVLARRNGC